MSNVRNRSCRVGTGVSGVLTAAGLVLLSGWAGGCSGHGSYTKAHLEESQKKLAEMKSGTEWQMAQQQFLAGDLDKAHKTIDRSLSLNDKVSKSHVLKGRILMEKGQLENARLCFLEAERLDEKNVEAQYYLGIVHERFNEPEQALEQYTKAGELDPANAQYVIAAADMLIQLGRLDEAEQFLLSKRSNFEYNAAIRQSLGNIAMLRKDYTHAADLFREACTLSPTDMHVLEDLVRAQMTCGQYADAEVNVRRLLENENYRGRRDLRHLQAKCLIAVDRPLEARQILVDLTGDAEGGRDVDAWVDLGNTSYILKDRNRLRQVASRLTAMAPTRHEGFMFRGVAQMIDGDLTTAISSFDQAAMRTSTDSTPLLLKGFALQDLGKLDDAKRSFAAAVKLDPTGPAHDALLALEGGTYAAERTDR
ncbi:MAG: tetratricopeptide repeat protein [Phycisphaerales bacterium]